MRKISEFLAQDDAGTIYEVEVWQRTIAVHGLAFSGHASGATELRLKRGGYVNEADDGTLTLSSTGAVIHRIGAG